MVVGLNIIVGYSGDRRCLQWLIVVDGARIYRYWLLVMVKIMVGAVVISSC